MSSFSEALRSEQFLVTVEMSPPKGVHLAGFQETLEGLAGKVDAVNLPDGRSANMHLGPFASSILAKAKGLEPILTLSCRDRNRLALSSDLLGAYALGLENVLCVSGDYFTYGDIPDAMPVYDLDSVQLIKMIRELETGRDAGGNKLEGNPAFCVGCVADPQANPLEPQLIKLDKKLAAGAEFVQTLDLYEPRKAQTFFDYIRRKNVKVLVGLRLITEKDVRRWESGKMTGTPVPEALKAKIMKAADPKKILAMEKERMVRTIEQVRNSVFCHGIHITAEGNEALIPEIIEMAGI